MPPKFSLNLSSIVRTDPGESSCEIGYRRGGSGIVFFRQAEDRFNAQSQELAARRHDSAADQLAFDRHCGLIVPS